MLIVFGLIFGFFSAVAFYNTFVIGSILYLLISSLFFCTDRIVVAIESLKDKS